MLRAAKATVLAHIDPAKDCPILDGSARTQFTAAARAANDLSAAILEFLRTRGAKDQVAWLRNGIGAGRDLLQPWSLEILYVLAVLGRVRFTQLHGLLGLSSRTLSDNRWSWITGPAPRA